MSDKILLVDDERDIVDLIAEVLQQDGFRLIQKAYSGSEALRLCEEFNPDIVVLDIMLPDINGIEVCKKIREFSICSILFLSSKMMISTKYSDCHVVAMIISRNPSAQEKLCFG